MPAMPDSMHENLRTVRRRKARGTVRAKMLIGDKSFGSSWRTPLLAALLASTLLAAGSILSPFHWASSPALAQAQTDPQTGAQQQPAEPDAEPNAEPSAEPNAEPGENSGEDPGKEPPADANGEPGANPDQGDDAANGKPPAGQAPAGEGGENPEPGESAEPAGRASEPSSEGDSRGEIPQINETPLELETPVGEAAGLPAESGSTTPPEEAGQQPDTRVQKE